jgi:hypothetical protein
VTGSPGSVGSSEAGSGGSVDVAVSETEGSAWGGAAVDDVQALISSTTAANRAALDTALGRVMSYMIGYVPTFHEAGASTTSLDGELIDCLHPAANGCHTARMAFRIIGT